MKLPNSNIHTEVFGSQQELTFGIGNAGLIFEILRNKMYKNPILAIVREISCNARDAHREIGKSDVPILIQLPNAFSSEFKITDYGPGISPERMENIFINYGSSTKREDNVQTGGFGLGAKTPFSYSDTFNIETIYDGFKYNYIAYIDESRAGKIILSSKSPTQEPNGTSIIIPVKRQDFEEFKAAVVNCCNYWEVKPIVKPEGHISFNSEKEILSGDGWKLIDAYRQANFIIDGISYNSSSILDTSWANARMQLSPELEKLGIKKISISEVLRSPINFYFKVGEISLSASRDSIHLDTETQKNLEKRLVNIVINLIKHAKNQIECAPTYVKAITLKNLIQSNFRFHFINEYLSSIRWNGYILQDCYYGSDIASHGIVITNFSRQANETKFTYNYGRSIIVSQLDEEKTLLLFQTGEKTPTGLLTHLYNDPKYQKITKIILIKDVYDQYVAQCAAANPVVTPEKYHFNHDLLKILNVVPVTDIVIPKSSRKSYTKSKASKGNVMAYPIVSQTMANYNFGIGSIFECNLDQEDIYIEYDYEKKKFISGDINFEKLNYSDLIDIISIFGFKLVAFTPNRAKKLGKKWIPFSKISSKIEDDFLKNHTIDYIKEMYYCYNSSFYLSSPLNQLSSVESVLARAGLKNNITKLFELKKECSNFIEKNKSIFNLLSASGKLNIDTSKLEIDSKKSKLYKLYITVYSEYPLLPIIDYYSTQNVTAIVDYIKLIDQSRKSSLLQTNQKEINNVNQI